MRKAVRLSIVAAGVAVATALVAGVAAAAWTSSVSAGPMAVATGHIAAPSGLSVSQASCTFLSRFTINFSWTAASPTTGVSGYEIAYSTDGGSTWTNQYGPVTSTTFTSPNRTDWSKAYLFRVTSLGPGNWTAPSASVSYTTPNAFCFGRTQGLNSLLVTGEQTSGTTTTDTTTTDTQTTPTQTTPTQTTETTTTETTTTDSDTDTTDTTSSGSSG